MSKKQLRNRLENLFSTLAENRSQSTEQASPSQSDPVVGSVPAHEESPVSPAATPQFASATAL